MLFILIASIQIGVYVRSNIPSLKALRAFESAARYLSFTEAAIQLNVTQAAISKQIGLLEEQLNTQLFIRNHRELVLTPTGQALLDKLIPALNHLELAISSIQEITLRPYQKIPLRVCANPAVASFWLSKRINDFKNDSVEIHLSLSSGHHIRAGDELIDIEIYYGPPPETDLYCEELMKCTEFPVCSPQHISHKKLPLPEEELLNTTLLHLETYDYWPELLADTKLPTAKIKQGPIIDDGALCLQMAILGKGTAIGDDVVNADHLFNGELVRPYNIAMPSGFNVYFLCKKADLDNAHIVSFLKWIKKSFQKHKKQTAILREKAFYIAS